MEPPFYCYATPTSTGGDILHLKGCSHLDDAVSRIFLGSAYTLHLAVGLARRHGQDVTLCPWCIGTRAGMSGSGKHT